VSTISSQKKKKTKIKMHKTIILPVALYGFETWSLTLKEECRLRAIDNRLLRRIFGPKREEGPGGWKRLYTSPNIIRVIKSRTRMARHVPQMGEIRNFGWKMGREKTTWKTYAVFSHTSYNILLGEIGGRVC
jgi:hypothetical protein